jgi:hypothetical protein
MPREFGPGTPALYKYQSIKYFPFEAEPGASYVLTSDPFSYLKTWFRQQAGTRQSPKKSRMDKGRYFVDLAEEFAIAAESVRLPTKATLVYYSLLNLVKAYLCANEVELERIPELHGLAISFNDENKVSLAGRPKKSLSIFTEFYSLLVLAERNSFPFQPVPSAGSGQAFSVLLRRKSITWLARLNFSSLSYEKIPALILKHYFAPKALVISFAVFSIRTLGYRSNQRMM